MSEAKVTLFTAIKSAFAALAGIQSQENRKRDFEHGKAWHFVVAGIIVTALFIGFVFFLMAIADL